MSVVNNGLKPHGIASRSARAEFTSVEGEQLRLPRVSGMTDTLPGNLVVANDPDQETKKEEVRKQCERWSRRIQDHLTISWFLENREEDEAIAIVKKAVNEEKYSELEEAFRRIYGEDLEGWMSKKLDLGTHRIGNCEVSQLASVHYNDDTVKWARNFAVRCWSGTDNDALAAYVKNIASGDSGHEDLLAMARCFGRFHFWSVTGNSVDGAFHYPEGTPEFARTCYDRFYGVLLHELNGSEHLDDIEKLIQDCINKHYIKPKDKIKQGDAIPPIPDRNLPIPEK